MFTFVFNNEWRNGQQVQPRGFRKPQGTANNIKHEDTAF